MTLDQLIDAFKDTQPKVSSSLKRVAKLHTNNDVDPYKLRGELTKLEKLTQVDDTSTQMDALRSWLQEMRAANQRELSEHKRLLGIQLDKLLQEQGLKLYGQFPNVHAGLFTLAIDFEKGACVVWYGRKKEQLARVTTLDAEKIVQKLMSVRESLGGGLDEGQFQTVLERAFAFASSENHHVTLREMLPYVALLHQSSRFLNNPLRKNYQEYGRADFSFDLFRHEAVRKRFKLATATRQQTQKSADSLWIPVSEDIERGSNFATIMLKEG